MSRHNNRIAVVLAVLALVLLVAGCDPQDPTYTTYYDEIKSFIMDSEDGRELFTTNIYPEEPFHIDDTLMVLYLFDSIARSIDIDISDKPRDIYGFNSKYEAVARISDKYHGGLYRISDNDTTLYLETEIRLERYAYFLKLYDDGYQYHGWRFWGYAAANASDTLYGTFTSQSGEVFSAAQGDDSPTSGLGNYFILKNNIPRLPLNDSLTYLSDFEDIIFAETADGKIRGLNSITEGLKYKTGWRIPSATSKFYHLITFDGPWTMEYDTTYIDSVVFYVDTALLKLHDFAIPYKANISTSSVLP